VFTVGVNRPRGWYVSTGAGRCSCWPPAVCRRQDDCRGGLGRGSGKAPWWWAAGLRRPSGLHLPPWPGSAAV